MGLQRHSADGADRGRCGRVCGARVGLVVYALAPPPPSGVPYDPGLPNTDTRLQQILVENRVQSMMLAQAFNITDDPQTVLRPDVRANDASLSS